MPPYQIAVTDLRGQSSKTVQKHIATWRDELANQVLPAEEWPLFDIRATQLDDNQTRLHISLDVLFCDFGSLLQLFTQWQKLYADLDWPLPQPSLSFRDYVLAEQQLETTATYAQAREYWLGRLDTLPPAPELPLAQDATSLEQTHFRRRSARLTEEKWGRLKTYAGKQGLTPNGVLLAAFAEVLACWSKSPRLTLNLTLFNRLPLHPEVDDLVGDFTAINLLAVDNSSRAPFVERAQALQQQLWADLEQRAFDGIRVIRELARQQGETGQALMPVVFTSGLGLEAGCGFEPFGKEVYSCSQTPQVWLDHVVIEKAGQLNFSWNTVDDLFPAGLMDDMFSAYCDLLARLADASRTQLWQATHPVEWPVTQQEQRRAVNATDAPISDDLLHTLFLQQVEAHADEPAVITPPRTLTYRELYIYANTIAHWLRKRGAVPNQLVAVVMEKGWEQVAAVLGIQMAGAAYLPIDPNLPTERQAYLLEQGEVTLLLTQSELEATLIWPEEIQCLHVDNVKADDRLAPLETIQQVTDLAYVIYTSGSTGLPKGVVIDHRGAVNTVLDINRRFAVTSQDRVLALSALNFDLSVYDIFGLLAAGGTIVMPSPDLRVDPAHWLELMVRHRVTLWNTVPALMQMLVDYFGPDDQATRSRAFVPSSLRLVMMSGDWIPVTLPDRIKSLWDDIEVYSLGGATEASIWSIYYPIDKVEPTWVSIPYGKPLTNQSFHVLDHHLTPCPTWVPGDLYIGGIGLALGYWKDEAKSNERFIIHPESGERLYKTGDLGRYLPDGNIEFLGREDFQVKIRGHRIELGEIESTLLQHSGIKEAVVDAVGDPKGSRQLVAYVVADGQNTDSLFVQEKVDAGVLDTHWRAFIEAAHQNLAQVSQEQEVDAYLTQWKSLDQLYMKGLYHLCATLGIYQTSGETYTIDELMAQYGIVPRYRKWLQRALYALVETGLLQQNQENFVSIQAFPVPDPESIRTFAAPAIGEASMALLTQTAANLANIITERIHSAEFYAQEANTTAVYQEGFDHINRSLCEVVRALVKKQPHDLNILEVGAGYGSTTTHLLPLLPERTRYTFTDVSDFFLQRAQQAFTAYPFLSYGLLNLERNPITQGYAAHSYHLIIAASVLHVPRQIEETLRHLRTLLAPGGLLVMIEETKFHFAYDLGMGLQQGFERFEDLDLRPVHPLLSKQQWEEQLRRLGFAEVMTFNQVGSIPDVLGIDIIIAQGPATVQRFNTSTLHDYLAKKLPDYMVPTQMLLLDALPLTANGKVDRKALPILDAQSTQTQELVLPETPTQVAVAEIWKQVLNTESVGIHQNFFGLGGDSLIATQALGQLRTTFKMDLALSAFLERPTVAEFATYIDVLASTRASTAVGITLSQNQQEETEVEEW